MAGTLVQVKFSSFSCALTRNLQSKPCVKSPNSVQMVCNLQTPRFPGLRGCNAMLGTSVGKRRGTKARVVIDLAQDEAAAKKMPTLLEEYGINLTELAEEGKLDPVVGTRDQIERVIKILGRRKKNLIGEPGVGKTSIAQGLAQRIATGDVPPKIKGKKVISLDKDLLVAGTKYRGKFEERLKKLMRKLETRVGLNVNLTKIYEKM